MRTVLALPVSSFMAILNRILENPAREVRSLAVF